MCMHECACVCVCEREREREAKGGQEKNKYIYSSLKLSNNTIPWCCTLT